MAKVRALGSRRLVSAAGLVLSAVTLGVLWFVFSLQPGCLKDFSSAECGNGAIEEGEACDDGNGEAGDGCDSTCLVEPNWQCFSQPSECAGICGDGVITADEACEGDDLDGETCSSQGFGAGTLSCLDTCQGFDTSLCIVAFEFVDQVDVALATLVQSNAVVILGLPGPTPVTISGDDSAQFRVAGGAWSTTGEINEGETLELRMTSSATHGTTSSVTVDVAGATDQWDVKTIDDTTPDVFAFVDLADQLTSTLVTSNLVQISGITGDVATSISGGGGTYRICTNGQSDTDCDSSVVLDWTSDVSSIRNNEFVQLRITTSAAFMTTVSTTFTIGTGADQWDATTGDCLVPGESCPDGTVYAGLSPDGNVPMYVTRCDAGQTWSGSSCTGTRTPKPWNNGLNGGFVDTAIPNCGSGSDSSTAVANTCNPSGESDTAVLVATDSDSSTAGVQPHQAAEHCDTLSLHGHSDWFLPSAPELDVIYTNRAAIGGFVASNYWSSSEHGSVPDDAWDRNMDTGSWMSWAQKNAPAQVRCVRKQ